MDEIVSSLSLCFEGLVLLGQATPQVVLSKNTCKIASGKGFREVSTFLSIPSRFVRNIFINFNISIDRYSLSNLKSQQWSMEFCLSHGTRFIFTTFKQTVRLTNNL